jgi:hypothetical protein
VLHIEGFRSSNGWLERFGTRQNVNFRFISGEAAAVDMEAAEEWKSKLQHLLNKYRPENQFNADETGLLYRQMPRKVLSRKVKM